MAVGLNGGPGQAVVTHVVVDHKHACVLAPIHLPLVVVQAVKVVVSSPNPVTRMDAKVRLPTNSIPRKTNVKLSVRTVIIFEVTASICLGLTRDSRIGVFLAKP